MAKLQLRSTASSTATIVSNTFIDNYMSDANGEFVKVYLYLLRHMNACSNGLSISAIADFFNHTEKDIMRALKYWEKNHLLVLEYDSNKKLCGICLTEATTETVAAQTAATQTAVTAASFSDTTSAATTADSTANVSAVSVSAPKPQKRHSYSIDEVSNFKKDPNISELFFIIETYLKHPMTSTDINTVLYWYDQLHFSTELIVYLVEYCICKGHSSMRYMDKVALGWHESNITTVEQAKEQAAQHSQAYYGVMKALGITGRNLVDSEVTFVNKWAKEYSFDLALIQEACKRTMSATHQPSFEYTDRILTNWHQKQVHTMDDIKKLDESHARESKTATISSASNTTVNASAGNVKRTKFTNFNQREYDYEELEKMLLNTSVK